MIADAIKIQLETYKILINDETLSHEDRDYWQEELEHFMHYGTCNDDYNVEDEFQHAGVKGMKWGERKDSYYTAVKTAAKKISSNAKKTTKNLAKSINNSSAGKAFQKYSDHKAAITDAKRKAELSNLKKTSAAQTKSDVDKINNANKTEAQARKDAVKIAEYKSIVKQQKSAEKHELNQQKSAEKHERSIRESERKEAERAVKSKEMQTKLITGAAVVGATLIAKSLVKMNKDTNTTNLKTVKLNNRAAEKLKKLDLTGILGEQKSAKQERSDRIAAQKAEKKEVKRQESLIKKAETAEKKAIINEQKREQKAIENEKKREQKAIVAGIKKAENEVKKLEQQQKKAEQKAIANERKLEQKMANETKKVEAAAKKEAERAKEYVDAEIIEPSSSIPSGTRNTTSANRGTGGALNPPRTNSGQIDYKKILQLSHSAKSKNKFTSSNADKSSVLFKHLNK